MNSCIEYHLQELAIACNPQHERHAIPRFTTKHQHILDIGCGIGQLLVASNLPPETQAFGIDLDDDALSFGRKQFPNIRYLHASAEALPFADNSFDIVVSRVCLPYTQIDRSLAEIHRVIKPGGDLWITLHPYRFTQTQWLAALKDLAWKELIFRTYVLLNGIFFHYFSRVLPFPRRQRTESFQTSKGIKKCLEKTGFDDIVVSLDRCFVVTAKKR